MSCRKGFLLAVWEGSYGAPQRWGGQGVWLSGEQGGRDTKELSCNLLPLSVEIDLLRCLSSLTHFYNPHQARGIHISFPTSPAKYSSTSLQSPCLQTTRQQTGNLLLAFFNFSSSELDDESPVYPHGLFMLEACRSVF